MADAPPRALRLLEERLALHAARVRLRAPGIVDELPLDRTRAVMLAHLAARLEEIPGARDVASRVISSAFADGRAETFSDATVGPDGDVGGWERSAVLDANVCEVCAGRDGETSTLAYDEACDELGLPGGGPDPDCLGGERCRCSVLPSAEVLAPIGAPGVESGVMISAPPEPPPWAPAPVSVREQSIPGAMTETTSRHYDVAMDAIDRTHRFPSDAKGVSVVQGKMEDPTWNGFYQRTGGPRAANRIALAEGEKAYADETLTIIHEHGHYLDNVVGESWGKRPDAFASQAGGPDAPFREIMAAIGDSPEVHVLWDEDAPEYWIRPRELFARAYAQYIAEAEASRGGRQALVDAVVAQKEVGRDRWAWGIQWDRESFAPIRNAFDSTFRRLGYGR